MVMEWEDRLDAWELELELTAQLEGSDWVRVEQAAADTGASRAALCSWDRTGQIPLRARDPSQRTPSKAPPPPPTTSTVGASRHSSGKTPSRSILPFPSTRKETT